tara:strand:- start:266 stop:664 length:399 start_codon:yes stop_codon:yes gene_type:complete
MIALRGIFMNFKNMLYLGAFSSGISVLLGAFAAHYLKNKLSTYEINIFETGVRYQIYHSLSLLILGILQILKPNLSFSLVGILFSIGIVLFSGSLYIYTLSNNKYFAMVTPLGGLLFLFAWLRLTWIFINLQ